MRDYKILLVCSGGMSTTILMTKMQKYAEEKGFSLEIDACSAAVCQDKASHYDVVLLGPQIAYQKVAFQPSFLTRLPRYNRKITRWLVAKTFSNRLTK